MSSTDASVARIEAGRERVLRALKNTDGSLEAFGKAIRNDALALEYLVASFWEDIERDRPELKGNPQAILKEAIRRLEAETQKRKSRS
jgi:hypothetical protein